MTTIEWTDELRQRFWNYVNRGGADVCWEWRAGRFSNGMRYGQFRAGKRKLKAHRVAWELTRGPIPERLRVLHRCDNPICCNPAHHFLGTDADNAADREAKGRGVYNGTSLPGVANPAAKLTPSDVARIRELAAAGVFQRYIAKRFKISQSQVGNIVRGKCWRAA